MWTPCLFYKKSFQNIAYVFINDWEIFKFGDKCWIKMDTQILKGALSFSPFFFLSQSHLKKSSRQIMKIRQTELRQCLKTVTGVNGYSQMKISGCDVLHLEWRLPPQFYFNNSYTSLSFSANLVTLSMLPQFVICSNRKIGSTECENSSCWWASWPAS